MSTQTNRKNGKSKTVAAKPEEPEEMFSYDFLEMLHSTAHEALHKYSETNKTPDIEKVLKMHNVIYSLCIEQSYIMAGGGSRASMIWDVVARASMLISEMGGEFHEPNGSITPLKEWRELLAKRAAKS